MAVRIFDTLRKRVEDSKGLLPQEKRAMFWFRNYSTQLLEWQNTNKKRSFAALAESDATKLLVAPKSIRPGYLYFFLYQPLYAKELDYYDRLPLTLVLDVDSTGFLAINFHYLPYRVRAAFFDLLYSTRLVKRKDPLKTRINVTYKLLQAVSKYKAFRVCLRRYRFKNVRSGALLIGESEWDIAMFLPVEQFAKATRTQVWNESLANISDIEESEIE